MNDKVLVVKLNYMASSIHIDSLHKAILTQMEGGVVVLPYGCDAIVVPEGIEVRVEGKDGEAN